MDNLPPELKKFDLFLDNLPGSDNAVFLYYLCLWLVKNGQLALNTVPTNNGELTYFQTRAGYKFTVFKPRLDPASEARLINELWPMLEEFDRRS